jgi:hypothetical protein
MRLDEAKQILKDNGFMVESYENSTDPVAELRRDLTNAAITKFEYLQYDEFEQVPWVEKENIKEIIFSDFLKVVMNAVNAKTEKELLEKAEDEDEFNTMANAWMEFLLHQGDCMGWDYTWEG